MIYHMKNIHWLALFLLGTLFGSSFVFAEILLQSLLVYTIVFLRIAVAGAIVLVGLVLYYRGRIIYKGQVFGVTGRQWRDLMVMAALTTITPFVFVVYGQQFVSGGFAAIINAFTAFQGVILASLFFADERLRLHRILGVILGICGVVVAIGIEEIRDLDADAMGGLFILIGTFSIACSSVWAKKRLRGVPIMVSVMAVHLFGALEMLPFMVALHADQFTLITQTVFTQVVLYAIVASVCAFPLYFYLIQSAGSAVMPLNTIIVVPSAIVLEYIFLGVPVVPNQLYGFMVIAMGLLVLDGRILAMRTRWQK